MVLPVSWFEQAGNAFINSPCMIDADGSVLGFYRKSHIPNGPASRLILWLNVRALLI